MSWWGSHEVKYFFTTSMADVVLWLGPYMIISSKNIICTRTQKVRKCRQITINQKLHKLGGRPANPPARFAFRQEEQQTRHTKGAEPKQKHPQKRFALERSGLTTASRSKMQLNRRIWRIAASRSVILWDGTSGIPRSFWHALSSSLVATTPYQSSSHSCPCM